MQDIKVSIIIPVYNVADYLRRCLDSCVNQSLQEIEIIVVNDCSPYPHDSEIMKEYEKKFHNKVKCIWHKENKKQGGARNTGIRAARGEFIYCVDSDDYIDLTATEKMYNAIIAENADMAVCDCNYINDGNITKNWRSGGKFDTLDLCERIKNIKTIVPWMIMIKKSVIEDNNLFFPEKIFYEDLITSVWYLASPKIVRINEVLYYYVMRSTSVVQEKKYISYILGLESIKYILNLNYFNNLDILVKKTLFLLYIKRICWWGAAVRIKYPTEFIKYCHCVLDLFKIYKVDYNDNIYTQSELYICYKEILSFIEQNVNMVDFNVEYAAYCDYQYRRMRLKKLYRLYSIYINKNLTIWGAGILGKRNAIEMNMLGIKFEITDINYKIHGEKIVDDIVIKPWDKLKNNTDVVLVSAIGIFEEVHDRLTKECPNIEVFNLIG